MKKNSLVLFAFLFAFSGCKQPGNFPVHAGVPLQLNLKGSFSLEKQYEVGASRNYVFKSAQDAVIISVIADLTDSVALAYRTDKLSLVNSLFIDQGTPYPGRVTNHQGCPDEFKPVVITDTKEVYAMSLKANERFVYGGCTDASSFYSSALIFIYCKQKGTLCEIKYFTPSGAPVNDLKEFVKSVSCL